MIGKATLLGRVGKKEHKEVKNGVFMTTLSVATNRKYIDAQGNKQEITNWHNVNCFNKLADIAKQYVHVGDVVYIEGEISNKKIDDGHGGFRWVYSVTGDKVQLLPQGKKSDQSNHEEPPKAAVEDNFDDSIPF